ncbi:PREDICTED: protein farnesyltransferase subunit beta isoform X2 [Wasmannia auropunctata]|nr:PREDICTED: protein farnesyltransferase subunit beta isoform X2 [Wasmannia auropunctata]XP_011707193.1 PREDICTED: protein farnesyltransferase subunit beta isoform X2 [Wasmannia auropunctata]XP_011707199.1 PREDICTED: protein farnesyltransferase subunit beta isoform X2 [Wasmannia auropunctata]XP_011707206.1 PREDICTED: protein farnesyltransferase subunit beta isoform X2 [Wasmannia auropunctata]XP_011707207.1 PREDICTED: protein farnesyltransferase subunit beta isoform X2 [Wasmannia auropunctata]
MSDLESGVQTGRRSYEEILKQRQDESGRKTATTNEQARVEDIVLKFYRSCREGDPVLLRPKHIQFLKRAIAHLNDTYECLDSSRPWLCFWILHSLAILGERLEDEEHSKIAGFLAKCQSPTGGFGGGPGQHPHLASTYAAVNALCTIGTREAYDVIDRKSLKRFLTSLRGEDGSFCMHENGEVDIRGAYCALAAAKLTNVYTPDMFRGTAEWIAKCQTWEGGFGGCPGMEAHGGYAYCALAALVMLGKTELCQLPELLRWIVNKQMRLEGGFQGRTNKLVDGCYSFWQGGTFPLIAAILSTQGKTFNSSDHWLFNQEALQEYILICCQNPHGGLLDKPGKNRDIYHTCYVLSGLSIAQNSPIKSIIGKKLANKVEVIHPVYNVEYSAARKAQEYFPTLPIPAD